MVISWPIEQGFLLAFSFIGFVLVYIPLIWHLQAWNVGCILYIFWTGTSCLIQFINMMVWRNNAINWAPVWCDIITRFSIATSIGIPTASLIINRRLYKIASVNCVQLTRGDKRRAVIIDLSTGVGLPVLAVALNWFIQGHRFNIFEGVGCQPAIPWTIPSIFLLFSWPIVIGVVSAVYCLLTLRAFLQRRKQFAELIAMNNNLTLNRYFRLMGLSAIEFVCTIPMSAYSLSLNAQRPFYVWRGLTDIHLGFSRVEQYPTVVWRSDPEAVISVEYLQWSIIVCAIIFFSFFGLAEEARKHYQLAYTSVAKKLGYSTGSLEQSTGFNSMQGSKQSKGFGRITIPSFVQRAATGKRASMVSFSDKLSTSISIGDLSIFNNEEKTQQYSPTESTMSGSFVVTPIDEGSVTYEEEKPEVPELAMPAAVHDIEAISRHTPDVPSAVRPHSEDMA